MSLKSTIVPYQWPRRVDHLSDCEFYHTIDLPDVGTQLGAWDLRNKVGAYVGDVSLAGKTVLDVGTGSGFLCFEMEKSGADMIAFDFDGGLINRQHDVIPYHDFEARFKMTYNEFFQRLTTGLDRMKNSFWLSHHLLKSKARVFYGDLNNCEVDFGRIDYVFFGNILLHLMSPARALSTFAPYAAEKVIVTEACFRQPYDYSSDEPACYLVPTIENKGNFASWWQVTPGFLKQYLGILGFTNFALTFHEQRWATQDVMVPHFTLVASR